MSSKLIKVLMILLALFCVAIPVIFKIMIISNQKSIANNRESLLVNNQTVMSTNPFYHNIERYSERKKDIEDSASTKTDDLAIELLDELLNEYLHLAKHIKTKDFRNRIVWEMEDTIINLFIHNHMDTYTKEELGDIFDKAGLNLDFYEVADDETEKQKILEYNQNKYDIFYKVVEDCDFIAYYNFRKQELQQEQTDLLENKKTLEKKIVERPEKEEMYSEQIESQMHQLTRNNIRIEILDYRIENRVVPDHTDWRNSALSSKENALKALQNKMLTREEFEEDGFYKQRHKSYYQYKMLMQSQQDEYANDIVKADKSLAANKPDMEFVIDGVRRMSTRFLVYSLLVSLFGILIGGGLIAKEFETGTIRLLLIRPITRTKLVWARLFALILVCFMIFTIGVILNMLTNGILFGFEDFSNPNFTVSTGENGVSFFVTYIGKFFVCFISIIVACVMAVSLSMLTKNTAVSVAVPIVIKFASLVLVIYAQDTERFNWVYKTFLPYMNICMYESEDWWYGFKPIMSMGIPQVIVLTTIIFAISLLVFKKRDIAN
jgi:ABC-2 type transport system permease protein